MTKRCGLFGYPLSHSISAIFQQAAFENIGLDISYQAWETAPDHFAARFDELRSPDVLGCNITIPHKEAALRLVDTADPIAQAVGAVNTVSRRGSQLSGYNTDVAGFLDLMRLDVGFDACGASVVVLGAGGAARAICLALQLTGTSRLTIANRSAERAHALRTHLAQLSAHAIEDVRSALAARLSAEPELATPIEVLVTPWLGVEFSDAIARAHLIVNCTSAGMLGSQREISPLPDDAVLKSDAIVVDIVANPLETRLMESAARAGHRTIGGLPMLLYQGAESFRIWTDQEPPLDVMRRAAIDHMLGKG